ncbi:TPA: aminotransferase, partial [Pseudomonas aeruginosa]|nr:aminotransferase [Pseudomonas aeruginosa]
MPALSRRSFVTLTALASSSILLSPRAFAGSGATSAAGKPQETFLDFNESPYGPS